MSLTFPYIVQFVGFKTHLSPHHFFERWQPIAMNFKKAGIQTIDLYTIQGSSSLQFISRNIWKQSNYFQNFRNGIAANVKAVDIIVQQFGGFWINEDELIAKTKLQIAFLEKKVERVNPNHILRSACSSAGPYQQMLELAPSAKPEFSKQYYCEHLTTL